MEVLKTQMVDQEVLVVDRVASLVEQMLLEHLVRVFMVDRVVTPVETETEGAAVALEPLVQMVAQVGLEVTA